MKSTGLVFRSRDYIGSAEPPATVLEDESRFGNDGAFLGDGQPDWVQLPSGLWVMDFDGTDDIVTIPDHASLSALSKITVMCWLNHDAEGSGGLVSKEAGANVREFSFYIATNITAFLLRSATDPHYLHARGTTDISDTTWHHTAATWNGVNAIGNISIYADGEAEAISLEEKVGTGMVAHDSAADVEIGRYNANNAQCLDGKEALVKIFNYVLSAGEIKQIFEAERSWFGV